MTTILYILVALIVFGILIFIHEFGHFICARLCGVAIKEFAIGMGPKLFSWKSKKYGTQYGLRLFPIGGFVSMEGEDEASENENAFCNKSLWKRILIVIAGPVMNILLGFLLMFILVFSQGVVISTTVSHFYDGALSNEQLQVGDTIEKVGKVKVHTGNELVYEIMNQGYEPVDLTVIRNGEKIVLEDVSFPVFEDSGAVFGNYDFAPEYDPDPSLGEYIRHAFYRSVSTVKMIYDSLFDLITGRYGLNAVSGPVGVTEVIGEAAKTGTYNLIYVVIVISINLGVFNLIPFPALDGGRLLFLVIEAIRRKPIKREVEGYINFVGMMLLFAFMIFVTLKDVIQLFR